MTQRRSRWLEWPGRRRSPSATLCASGIVMAAGVVAIAWLVRSVTRTPAVRRPGPVGSAPKRAGFAGFVPPVVIAPAPETSRAATPEASGSQRGRRATGPDLTFAALCTVVALWRFHVLTRTGVPPGVDSGNWLALGHDLFGDRLRSATIVYPPLVPLLVTGAAALFGLVNGVAGVTTLASLLPGGAVYFVLRRCGHRWLATALGALLIAGSATGEAAAWGGIPQLLSLGLLVMFLWALDGFLRRDHLGHAALAGVFLAVLLAASHLVAFAALLSASVLTTLHLVSRPRRPPRLRRLVAGGGLVLLPCLPLVPVYAVLAGGLDPAPASDRALVLLNGRNLVANVDFLFRDFALLWRIGLTAAVAMPPALWHRRHTATWALATSLLAGSGLAIVLTRQSRYLYLLPVFTVVALAVWAEEAAARRPSSAGSAPSRLLATGAAIVVAAQLAFGLNFFSLQRDYYGVLDPGLLSAVRWLRADTPPTASVAVTTGRHDQVLGWWVESLGRRRTLFASRLVWLNFDDERARARTANALFDGDFPTDATVRSARRAGIDFVLVAKTWPGYDATRLSRFRVDHPGAVVFENRSAVILRT